MTGPDARVRWTGPGAVLFAILAIVVFGYALANVTMRLQRHITAATQWKNDRRNLWMAYNSLSSAAAAKDELAYRLVLRIAGDDIAALQRDSPQMRVAGSEQRLEFGKQAQGCLLSSAATFRSQMPEKQKACNQLLRASQ